MNREEILQFKKRKYTKFGGFRSLGVILGLITLLAVVGGLVLALAFPMVIDLDETLIDVIISLKDDFVNEIIYWIIYGLVILGTALYLIVSGIKMLSKKAKYSANRNFSLPAFLAVIFVVFTTEKTCQYGSTLTFKLFKYLFLGGLVLSYVYRVIELISTGKLWKKNGKTLAFPYLIGFIATVASIVLSLTIATIGAKKVGFTSVYGDFWNVVNNAFAYNAIYQIPAIASVSHAFGIINILLIVLFFATLISVASLLVVDFIKIFVGKNYARGSKYFNKSGVFGNALMLAFIPVLINILTMAGTLIDGGTFDFYAFFTIENVVFFGGMLLIAIIVSAIFMSDKSKSKSELAELVTAKKIVQQEKIEEKPEVVLEEEIIRVDEKKEEIKEEPKEVVEEVKVEETPIKEPEVEEVIEEEVVEPEGFEEEIIEEVKEEIKEEPVSQQVPPVQPQQPYVANMNIYPNAIAGSIPAMQGVPNYGVPVQYYNPMTGQVLTYYAQPMPQPMAQPMIPAGQMMPQQMIPQGFIPFALGMQVGQNMAPVQPQQPVPQTTTENTETEEKPNFFAMPKKTLEEKIAELPQNLKTYYKQMISYTSSKEGVKYSKSTFADTFYYGRDCLMKLQVKQGKIVCSFSLVDIKAREMLKSDKYAKDQQTVVKIINKASLETAKDSFDMAYNLVLEAREARHQEQLRRRREARKAKKEQ